jgi:outer membrane protein OmpA-like peptidoglycan-associated protein
MNLKLMSAVGAAMMLGACASMPQPNAALEAARAAVTTAESDPNAVKYAALDLEAAKNNLAAAEDAYTHHRDAAIGQPAYLATQNARLAEARGAAKAYDARVAQGQTERDQIMLSARTREADNAKLSAANAKQEAALATQQAANANQQAANANQQAATSAQEAALANQQAANASEQTARVQAELDALKATPTPRGMVLTLGDVLFDTGRSQLKPGGGRKIEQLAQFLNEHPGRRVQIDGFTDSVGSDSYNEELSQRRADSVKEALLEHGIDPSRIGSYGYGKAYPVATNDESGGRQLNRRVEVVIGDDTGRAIGPRS